MLKKGEKFTTFMSESCQDYVKLKPLSSYRIAPNMKKERIWKSQKSIDANGLLALASNERGQTTDFFLDLYRYSQESLINNDLKEYPSKKELKNLSLTERSWLSLTEMESLPGGAGANKEVVVDQWLKAFEKHKPYLEKGRTLHIFAAIHGTFPPQVLMQDQYGDTFLPEVGNHIEEVSLPADRPYAETLAGASNLIHAGCSCGASGGRSENIRWKAGENVLTFLNLLKEEGPTGKRVVVHPVEAVLRSFDLAANGRQDIDFLLNIGLSVNNIDDYLRTNSEIFLSPSRERYNLMDNLISGEQFDMYLRSLMNQGSLITGSHCADSRQAFLNLPEEIKSIGLRQVSSSGYVRDDWQGEKHSEPFGIAILDKDEQMLRLAYELVSQNYYLLRWQNWSNLFGSASIPFLLNISATELQGEKAEWLKNTLQNLISAMDTEIYRRTADTGPTPPKRFIRSANNEIIELKLGSGFKLFIDENETLLDEIQPGILVYPPYSKEQKGQTHLLTKRNDVAIKVRFD